MPPVNGARAAGMLRTFTGSPWASVLTRWVPATWPAADGARQSWFEPSAGDHASTWRSRRKGYQMITTFELATELGVTEDDVQVHVDELIHLDGRENVIASIEPARYARDVTVVTLTAQAADDVRKAVAAVDPNAE